MNLHTDAQIVFSLLSTPQIQQGIYGHRTPPRYRNAASGRHASPNGPLRPNVTSAIKPEVRNVSQRRQRRIEPQGICTKKFVKIGSIDMLADRHTHRQTN